MIVFVTSCGRPDLLEQTLRSLISNNPHRQQLKFVIHEDSVDLMKVGECLTVCHVELESAFTFVHTDGIGQQASIQKFLFEAPDEKYYCHLEDDFEFDNSYDWISASIAIMEERQNIIKVLCRKDSQHPCEHDKITFDPPYWSHQWGCLQTWENEGIVWQGFSYNPGITRLDLLKTFLVPKWEQELAEMVFASGYQVAELKRKIYTHIGGGRSTHE